MSSPAALAAPMQTPQDSIEQADTPWSLWVAVVLSVLAIVAQFTPWLGWSALAFWVLVPGLLLVQALPATRVWAAGLVPAVSAAIVVLISTGLVWTTTGLDRPEYWQPRIGTVIVATICLGYAAIRLRSLRPHRFRLPALPTLPPWDGWAITSLVLASAALMLWLVTLPQIRVTDPDSYGLLLSDKWTFGAALVAAVLGFLVALKRRHVPLLWTLVAITILIQRGTGPLTLNAPWADWGYKHLGVIDLIAVSGRLHPGVDIYQAWPGFFAAIAWVSQSTGIAAFDIAVWFTVAITVATVFALYALARVLELGVAESLAAVMIALLANWVGQDYFSPQALGFLLAILVFALALRAKQSRAAWALAVVCFAALTITHQLTPFWVVGALGVLCLFRRVPWLLMTACAALAIAQLLANWDAAGAHGIFTGFDILANAETPAASASPSGALAVQMAAGRGTSIALWGLSGLIALTALIKQRWRGWLRGIGPVVGFLAFSPFVILGGQSYGGEALLRVLLYSVPGCALLIGPWLVRRLDAALWQRLVGGIVALAFALGGGQAYFGVFYHYGVTKAEFEVEAQLERSIPGTAYLSPLSAYWPVRASEAYAWRLSEVYYDLPMHNLPPGIASPDFLDSLEATLESRWEPTFLLVGPRMDAFAAYGGFAPPGRIEEIRETLRTRPGWEQLIDREGVTVFRYVPKQSVNQEASRWVP